MTLLNLSMLLNINFCQKTQKYLLTPELITTLLDKILFHATINKKIRLIKDTISYLVLHDCSHYSFQNFYNR